MVTFWACALPMRPMARVKVRHAPFAPKPQQELLSLPVLPSTEGAVVPQTGAAGGLHGVTEIATGAAGVVGTSIEASVGATRKGRTIGDHRRRAGPLSI